MEEVATSVGCEHSPNDIEAYQILILPISSFSQAITIEMYYTNISPQLLQGVDLASLLFSSSLASSPLTGLIYSLYLQKIYQLVALIGHDNLKVRTIFIAFSFRGWKVSHQSNRDTY